MLKNSLIIVLLSLLCCANAWAGDLIFGWNRVLDGGGSYLDMQFMPDNNEFMVMTSENFQIRLSETGDIVNSYSEYHTSYSSFRFTPDSNRLVMADGRTIMLRNLSDMSYIKSYVRPSDSLAFYFKYLELDPARPYAYVVGFGFGNDQIGMNQISVINYETGQLVKHLTPLSYTRYPMLAVSKDGKYLATICEEESYLTVWKLEDFSEYRHYKLSEVYKNSFVGEAYNIIFSEIVQSILYFSGSFSTSYGKTNSIFVKYNIDSNKVENINILDSNYSFVGYFNFINNEQLCIFNSYNDYLLKMDDLTIVQTLNDQMRMVPVIYSKNLNYIIGKHYPELRMLQYDSNTGIPPNDSIINILYPNPTNSIVNISLSTISPQVKYTILNSSGQIMVSENAMMYSNILQIDMSSFSVGAYYIRLEIGSAVLYYQVIKGE